MVAALLARSAGHVGDGAPGVNDQRELLRGRPDVQPRRVVPVGEEIVVEAHAGVRVRPVAKTAPQRGSEPAYVGVGAREREEQRRPRRGPIEGSGGGRGRGGQEEDGGEGLERAGPRPAATPHGAASSRGEWGGWRVGEVVATRGSRPGRSDDLLEEGGGLRGNSVIHGAIAGPPLPARHVG